MDRTALTPDPHYDPLSRRLAEPQSFTRTPSRRQQFTESEIKPLLSDLSPSSTLEALAATDAVNLGKRDRGRSFIQQSVACASTSERAWGIKAALASKKLQDWHQELSDWPWGGYGEREPNSPSDQEQYWGSVLAATVKGYEERIENIQDDMETLEVEDLKDYVRSTHDSRLSAFSGAVESETSYGRLDDFTAVITATIVQALPTLSRLNSLLSTWSIRLLVLRQVPAFVRDLADSQESMLSAWIAIAKPDVPIAKRRADFTRNAFVEVQAVLQDQISQLGRRLDIMLDLQEGSEDTLPESWVDGMDNLENDYSAWVVRAEELLLNNEMNVYSRGRSNEHSLETFSPNAGAMSDPQPPATMMNIEAQFDDIQQRANVDFDNGLSRGNEGRDLIESRDEAPSYVPDQENVHLNPLTGNKGHDDSSRETKEILPRKSHKPPPLTFETHSRHESTASSEADSDVSYVGSATSEYFSNRSSPEILDASVVEYLGSPGLKSPNWSFPEPRTSLDVAAGRRWSQQTERGGSTVQTGLPSGMVSPNSQRSRASTFVPEIGTSQDQELSNGNHVDAFRPGGHVRTRSASMQSFEIIPKHEIRQVLVRRSESYSSASSGLRHSETAPSQLSPVPGSAGKDAASRPSNDVDDKPLALLIENSTEKHVEPKEQTAEILPPLIPPKSRHRFEQVSDFSPGSTPVKIQQKTNSKLPEDASTTPGPPETASAISKSMDEQLEARISSILVSIPANIRLTSGPGPDAHEVLPSNVVSAQRTSAPRVPSFRMTRAQTTPSPTMTLAPAQPKTSKQKSQIGEPEIKLYHLHQPGKEAPIKLFVRLVGEAGERVMVRIGGGWADLGEYLKEYASHHGRRTASDSRFDIQTLQSSPLSSQVSSSSRPTTPSSSKDNTGHALKRGQTTPAQFETPKTPVSDPSLRPPSRSSTTWSGMDEDSPSLGLAGPKTKKFEISPQKQQWVDEMLDQARQGGTDKIGDLGKVGGTKRVFFRRKTEGFGEH
ncbi:hypothetical protein P7C71_g2240, partial [Lecanoromycetidae sp. Uapishka_2]